MNENLNAVKAADPEVFTWLEANRERSDFARSVYDYGSRKGYLSPGQTAAVLNSIERARQRAAAEANAPAIDTTRLEAVFQRALGNGLKKPALQVGEFRFNLAPSTGANPGAIYVKQDGAYLGKMLRGQFIARATGEVVTRVLTIAGDPEGEAIKHGKLTGRCAVCARPLSDPESVERGIGPICAQKFFA